MNMLQKEDILHLTNNGESVFRHYIKHNWREGVNFKNPFYNDTNPSFNIYRDRTSGTYRMKDGGEDKYAGDCFDLVGFVYNINSKSRAGFVEIMRLINRDLALGLSDSMENHESRQLTQSMQNFAITPQHHEEATKVVESRPYKATTQPFRESEMAYWSKYGIDKKTLERYNVVSIAEFTSISKKGSPYRYRSTTNEPIFGYKGEGYVKIYRPHSKAPRYLFGGEQNKPYCFGFSQLPTKGDVVFITGGEKDVLSLAARGFYAITFNSETSGISGEIIEILYHRFKHLIVLFDMDKAGIDSSVSLVAQYKKYKLHRIELPLSGEQSEKDVSDYFRIGYTRRDLINLFVVILDKMYGSSMRKLSSCEVDYGSPFENVEPTISLADVPIGTGGNLLGITGGEGTGKSCYVAALLSGAICSEESDIDTLGTNILVNKTHKAVLLYDTEQSKRQLKKNTINITRRAKLAKRPDEFKSFSLTSLNRKERMKLIIDSMDHYHFEFDGIHLVVIDGIADLVSCANDEIESIAIVDELYDLATIYNTCIAIVLHFVPNGIKLRGHLGSEVQRKAAAILSIEKDKDPAISIVKALKVRDGSPLDAPLVQFSWNKELAMHSYLGVKSDKSHTQRKRHDFGKITQRLVVGSTEYTHTQLCGVIQQVTGLSERTAADYIKEMVNEGIITKNITTKIYSLNYDNQR